MRFLRTFFKWLLIVLILISAGFLLTGNAHVFKALQHTYLKGRSGPSPDEYRVFPYRTVKAGKEISIPLSAAYNRSEIPDTALDEFSRYKTFAYLVIKNDSLLFEQYWDGYHKGSVTNSFSMAKTFVSVLTGIAIGEGKIKSVDEPVGNYLPSFHEGKKASITIRHLLTMSSGIDFDEDYVSPFAYPARAYYGTDITGLTLSYNADEEPGKVFKYLSGNTELMAMVLEKATGMRLSEYAAVKLWQPLGASQDAYWSLDHEDGMEKAYCCFNSNARDFSRIGSLYLHKGRIGSFQLVPENFVAESIVPAPLFDTDGRKQNRYGFTWWMLDYKGMHIYYARGILGQYVFVIPDKNLVVVRLGHKRSKEKTGDHPNDIYTYINTGLALAR